MEKPGAFVSPCYNCNKELVIMANYLDQVESTYYFHRSVPKALRPYLRSSTGKKRTDFKISLGTKDRGAAKARIPFYIIQTNQIFSQARDRLESGDALPSGPGDCLPSFDKLEVTGDAYEDAADYWEKCLDRHRDELSVHESAVVDLLTAARDAAGGREPTVGGVYAALPESGLSILGLYEGFASQPGLRSETVKQYRSIVRQFIEWLGFDDALIVEASHIVRWRNYLSESLSKRGTPLSPKTINTSYLTAVNLTFAYGLNNLLIHANPCQGVARVRAEK
jgi:hypothetical protein